MKVIAVINCKGGTGKTTTAIHAGAEMAARGLKVAVVDVDPAGAAGLWAEPGNLPMPVHAMPVTKTDRAALRRWERKVRALPVDIVILDGPPHLGAELAVILNMCDLALIPCTPSGLDLEHTAKMVELIHDVRRDRAGKPDVLLLPNKVDRRSALGREMVPALNQMSEPVAPAIGYLTAIVDAFTSREWVGAFAPRSLARRQYRVLADRILEHLGKACKKRPPPEQVAGDYIKKMTLRLDEQQWEELRQAAFRESTPDRKVSMHDIMLEGLDLALRQRRKRE